MSDAELIVTARQCRDGDRVLYDTFVVTGIVDGKVIGATMRVECIREVTTTDDFIIDYQGAKDRPTEIETGWMGLVMFFKDIKAADLVCQLTRNKINQYPDDPELWMTRLGNWVIRREPKPGSHANSKNPPPYAPPCALNPPEPPLVFDDLLTIHAKAGNTYHSKSDPKFL